VLLLLGPADAIVLVLEANTEPSPKFMQTKFKAAFKYGTAALLFILAGSMTALSQEVSLALLQPAALQPAPLIRNTPVERPPLAPMEHRFLDNKNRFLFAAVAGMSAADFAVTRANLRSGGREINPVTRIFSGSTAGLAANFAGETAGVIGLSYIFHKTGHHKLERMTSLVNIGASAGAVAYGLAHR
jgi:hypothetical protein